MGFWSHAVQSAALPAVDGCCLLATSENPPTRAGTVYWHRWAFRSINLFSVDNAGSGGRRSCRASDFKPLAKVHSSSLRICPRMARESSKGRPSSSIWTSSVPAVVTRCAASSALSVGPPPLSRLRRLRRLRSASNAQTAGGGGPRRLARSIGSVATAPAHKLEARNPPRGLMHLRRMYLMAVRKM